MVGRENMVKPQARNGQQSRSAPRWAIIGIFVIMAFSAATLARDFLMPLTLGVLLFFVFSPVCRFLVRLHVPRGLAAGLITLTLLAGLVVATLSLAVPLTNAIDNAPRIFARMQYKMEALRGPVEEIQKAAEQIDEISAGNKKPGEITARPADDASLLTQVARNTPGLFAQFVFTLVLLYFMLASGNLLYRRVVESFSGIHDKRRAIAAMHEIESSLGRYLGSITLINAGLGLAIGLAMWAWGMPAPALFGVAAFAFNFVPYLGALGGVVLSTVVALITMPGVFQPVLVGLTYFALTSFEGQFVTPYLVSRRLQLNTVVVFVAVALWAWLWSVVGMIVAVPMLVVFRVLCSYIPGMQGLGNLLAGEAPPAPGEPEHQARKPAA